MNVGRMFRALKWAATKKPQPEKSFESELTNKINAYQPHSESLGLLLMSAIGMITSLVYGSMNGNLLVVFGGIFLSFIPIRAALRLDDLAVRRRIDDLGKNPITIDCDVIIKAERTQAIEEAECDLCRTKKAGEFYVITTPNREIQCCENCFVGEKNQ